MTYQALARKWRPSRFADVVGQPHVVAALTHALDNDRVHHAFLFTGTRGVGKTTLARLLAKSLNCELGVGSNPCGECGACRSVEEGRFVDLLEIDAASRTRVDDTREILDNVQYAPTMGRYKVYLVDEVHMLSTHSFNALLKTLEEPPPHVKFLLATTDPQKLPATILSRCLQFNLRALDVPEIAGQLARILEHEGIESDDEARELVARAADGSMRDALSLLDQAIAFSGARLDGDSVREMLGMIEGARVVELLEAVATMDTARLFAVVDAMRARSVNFTRALDDLMVLLHEIALAQQAPELAAMRDSPWSGQLGLAGRLDAEQVQLYYQVALIGKRDLPLAPDPARGFEMVMLRMLAFDPEPGARRSVPAATATQPVAPTAATTPAPAASTTNAGDSRVEDRARPGPVPAAKTSPAPAPVEGDNVHALRPVREAAADEAVASKVAEGAEPVSPDGRSWAEFAETGTPEGLVRELAMNLEFLAVDERTIRLRLADSLSHLLKPARMKALAAAAGRRFGDGYRLDAKLAAADGEASTPAVQRARRLEAEHAEALQGLQQDPALSAFIEQFDAEVIPETVQPAKHRGE